MGFPLNIQITLRAAVRHTTRHRFKKRFLSSTALTSGTILCHLPLEHIPISGGEFEHRNKTFIASCRADPATQIAPPRSASRHPPNAIRHNSGAPLRSATLNKTRARMAATRQTSLGSASHHPPSNPPAGRRHTPCPNLPPF